MSSPSNIESNSRTGWFKVYRSIFNHWVGADPVSFWRFSKLISEVNYFPSKFKLGDSLLMVERGQSTKSLRSWAVIFNCTPKTVSKFFDLLEEDGMISRQTIGKGKHSTTLVTVRNYDQYQGGEETLATTLDTTLGKHKIPTIKEGKNEKKGRGAFTPPTLDEVRKEISEKGYTLIDPERFHSYYESNGWKVGRSSMKDWKAALRTWVSRERTEDNSKSKDVSWEV